MKQIVLSLLCLSICVGQAATSSDVVVFETAFKQWFATKSSDTYEQLMYAYEVLRLDTIRPRWAQMAQEQARYYGIDIEQMYQIYIALPTCSVPASLPSLPTPAPLPPAEPPQPSNPIVPIVPNPLQPDPEIPVAPTPTTPTPEPQPQPVSPLPMPLPDPAMPNTPTIPSVPAEPTPTPEPIPAAEPQPTPIPQPVVPAPIPGTETTNNSDLDEEEFCLATFIASLIPEIKSYVQKKDPRKIPESFMQFAWFDTILLSQNHSPRAICIIRSPRVNSERICIEGRKNIICRNTSCIFCQNRMDMVRFSLLRLQIAQKYLKQRSRQQFCNQWLQFFISMLPIKLR